ncbi:saccharopine dehydrogenase family protein [Aliikangiella sp. IMCC44359]|uniref:saccharopine dehydrogenase family protein n=1 Tax=Aliikangiella sp. IMCC44359 TaxID=3459125 RepID=UPI00403AA6A0
MTFRKQGLKVSSQLFFCKECLAYKNHLGMLTAIQTSLSNKPMHRPIGQIIILGGYGNFGKRVVKNLCQHLSIRLILAGRNIDKAENCCQTLSQETGHKNLIPLALDIDSQQFESTLVKLSPDILIHTSGPFQGQNYKVAKACLKANCHYIDLADDRRFVCDFTQLNQQACQQNLLFVSGASSVPGLSSTVVTHFKSEYQSIDSIDIVIAPGNKAERGKATVEAILSYTGKPISLFKQNQWQTGYGWMSSRRVDLGDIVGKRWVANVDVPDLELFPQYYPGVKTVSFQAGLELAVLHHAMTMMAWLVRLKLVPNWAPMSNIITKVSEYFIHFGTDIGGMRVEINGINQDNKHQKTIWKLIAPDGIGPFIPSFASIILANQLINGEIIEFGAKACINLFSLEEFEKIAAPLGIYHITERSYG